MRKLEKAKSVITEHIIEEEDSEEYDTDSDEEELMITKRAPKQRGGRALVQKVTKLTQASSKRRSKRKDDDERIARLEQLLANQLTEAKKLAKKAVKKPRTKTTVVKVEQAAPKVNDQLQKYAKATLLDLGL